MAQFSRDPSLKAATGSASRKPAATAWRLDAVPHRLVNNTCVL